MTDQEVQKSTYTPTKYEQKQISLVYDRLEKMKERRRKFEPEWRDAEKKYEMHREQRAEEEWRADLKLPDTFSVVETAKAEMIDQSPGIVYRPRESGDAEKADKLNKIFEYTWEKGVGDLELIKFMTDALIYGTAIGEEYWRKDICEYKDVEEFDLEKFVPVRWKKHERVEYDDVYFRSLSIWDFYVDEKADSLETARDCAKRLVMPYSDFKKKYKIYPKHKKAAAGGDVFRAEWFNPVDTTGDDEIEVIHYYNVADDLYLIVANGVLLTAPNNPNPYKHKTFPFVRAVDVMRSHSFYGIGEPKVLRSLQDERDTLRNMRLDTGHLNIQKQYIVDDRLELNDDDLVARPHGIIRGPVDSIRPLENVPINPEAYREEELLNDDMIKATGIDIRMQSLGGREDTATEVAILKESALKRIRMKLRVMELMALTRIARLRLANIQQFYSLPKVVSVLGAEGTIEEKETFRNVGFKHVKGTYEYFTARPEDITGEYDIIVVPGATLPVSKALEAQKAINLFDRLKGHPDVDQRRLAEDLIRVHDKNPQDIMTKPQRTGPPGGPMGEMLGGAGGPGTPPMPPVGVNRSSAKMRPEEALPGRAMAGGQP